MRAELVASQNLHRCVTVHETAALYTKLMCIACETAAFVNFGTRTITLSNQLKTYQFLDRLFVTLLE